MATESDVRAVLARAIHPSFGLSLTALGMVRGVRVTADAIEIDLVAHCPGCPGPEAVLETVRRALQRLDTTRTVRLNLLEETWHPPWQVPPPDQSARA